MLRGSFLFRFFSFFLESEDLGSLELGVLGFFVYFYLFAQISQPTGQCQFWPKNVCTYK